MRKLWSICVLMVLFTGATQARAVGRQQLKGHVPAGLAKASRIGSLENSSRLDLVLELPLRNQEALQAFLEQLHDPRSPQYRHFLTPEQFAQRYGPSEGDYQALAAFARSNNLSVVGASSDHQMLQVNGTVEDIQKAFHLNLNQYQREDGTLFYAPENEPSLDLDVPLSHISGLDNYLVPKPMIGSAVPHHFDGGKVRGTSAPAPGVQANAGSAPAGLYWGTDFRNAYVPGVCLTGTGQSVALIEFEGYYSIDITGYETLAGLPNVPLTNVLIGGFSGKPSSRDSNGILEVSLDIEMAISMSPGLSQVLVYEVSPTASNATADLMLKQIATDNEARQISCSWTGFGDSGTGAIFQQYDAQGQSFFQAAGDTGAYVTGDPTPTVPSPINLDPKIDMTVVGGTQLTMTGGVYQSETTWNAPLNGTTYGGGGGVCSGVTLPTYQKSVNMTANGGSTISRNIPDVSMVAYNIFVTADKSYVSPTNYTYYTVVGTSAATPLWASFLALANEQGAGGGVTVGFANPALYAIGLGGNYNSDFNDIADGSTNNLNGNPNLYKAVTGYDLATGWGSPKGQSMINGLTGSTSPCTPIPTKTFTSTPTRTPTSTRTTDPTSTPILTLTPTSAVTGTPTSTLVPTHSPTNSFTITNTPTNTYTVTNSPTNTYTITNTPTKTFTVTGTPTNTFTVTNTPTNTYTITNSSTSTYTITNTPTNSFTITNTPTNTFTITNTPTNSFTITNTPTNTFTITNTPTNSFTITNTPTNTFTITDTPTNTFTITNTSTNTYTITNTPTSTYTITNSPTNTYTMTETPTNTFTITNTPTDTFTITDTPTNTFTITDTPTNTYTITNTPTSTFTITNTPTNTYTITKTPANTFTITNTPTNTFTITNTPTNTYTITDTPANTFTITDTSTKTFTVTNTPTQTYTITDTPTSSFTITNTPTNTYTITNTPTNTYTITNTPTNTFTITDTPTNTYTITNTPTNTYTVTDTPTNTFTITNTPTSTSTITNSPTSTFTITNTPTNSFTITNTPTTTYTITSTSTNTSTVTNSPTSSSTSTFSPTVTSTPSPIFTATITLTLTPSPTPVPSPGGPTSGWSVSPNISRGGEPIQWKVTLTTPSPITLDLYDLAGELIYQQTIQGQTGLNVVSWDLRNQSGRQVASGIYVFRLDIPRGFPQPDPYGKVLVLH